MTMQNRSSRRATPQLRPVVREPYVPILDPEWDDEDASDGDDPVENCTWELGESDVPEDSDPQPITPPRRPSPTIAHDAPSRPPRGHFSPVETPFRSRSAAITKKGAVLEPPYRALQPRKLIFNVFVVGKKSSLLKSRLYNSRGAAKQARE